ncbi:MAG: alpha/beta hydrolase family protein [Acidobacteriota bacterium]|nr:alpha/beta hydrolase family protein [Acidobacteriota bacterium]
MTRRELGKLAGGSALLAQVNAKAASIYTGPLDGSLDKVDLTEFDPVAFSRKLYESAPLRLAFKAQNKKEAEAWQKKLRVKITELLGGFPSRAALNPLRPQTLEKRDFPAYTREKFIFESKPGVMVLGYLLLPKDVKTPAPTMICVPGHGRGVDDIAGIDDRGNDRTDRAGYQHDFAIQAAEHGMAAVAIEPMAFGCRRDSKTQKKGLTASACQPVAGPLCCWVRQ